MCWRLSRDGWSCRWIDGERDRFGLGSVACFAFRAVLDRVVGFGCDGLERMGRFLYVYNNFSWRS